MIFDNFEKCKNRCEVELKDRLIQINKISKNKVNKKINIREKKYFNIEEKQIILEFSHIKNSLFKSSNFSSLNVSNCILENIIFEECTFSDDNENVVFDKSTEFINCIFKNCNLKNVIFNNIKFDNCKFENSNMINCVINNSYIESIYIKDCDWGNLKIIDTLIKILDFEDESITRFNQNTFLDKLQTCSNNNIYNEDLYKIYKSFEVKFEENRLFKNAGEYYYLAKCEEQKFLVGVDKFKSYIFWLLCGYGERPSYCLITSLEILIIFTIIYMLTGLSVNGDIIKYDVSSIFTFPIKNIHTDFLYSLYFSIVTFTTVGYGDIIPIGIISMILSGMEMVVGITITGVWIATLTRKITR